MHEHLEKRVVTLNGKQASYWTSGTASQEPVVFVHGFRGNHKGLAPTASHLDGKRIIIPDLPGYGESEPWDDMPHTIQAYCTWLNDFCEALHLRSYVLVGHSFGATLAILYASQYSEHITKLILIAPVIASASWESFIGSIFYRTAEYLPSAIQRPYLINHPVDAAANIMLLKSAPLKRKGEIIMDGLRNVPNLDERIIMENFTSMYDSAPLPAASRITSPTYIIVGSKDSLSPIKSMQLLQEHIPHATMSVIPNEGHIIPLENPSALGNAIMQCLT